MEPGLGQPGDVDDHRGFFRRWVSGRRLVALLGVVLVPVVLVLLAPSCVVDPIARRNVSGYGDGCAELVGVRASPGRWPVVLRSLTGRLSDVSIEIDEVHFGDFEVRDVKTTAEGVEVTPLGLSSGADEVTVSGGETSSTLPFEEIEEAYAALDINLTLRRGTTDPATSSGTPSTAGATDPTDPAAASGSTSPADGTAATDAGDQATLIADVEVPWIGAVPTTVAITPVDGDVEIALAPFEYFWLPPYRIASEEPFEVRSVEVHEDAVRLTSTFEGTVHADDFGCDVTTGSPESEGATEPTGP